MRKGFGSSVRRRRASRDADEDPALFLRPGRSIRARAPAGVMQPSPLLVVESFVSEEMSWNRPQQESGLVALTTALKLEQARGGLQPGPSKVTLESH